MLYNRNLGNSGAARKAMARNWVAFAKSRMLQVKTYGQLQNLRRIRSNFWIPWVLCMSNIYLFIFSQSMENWGLIQENTDILRKLKGFKVFFHSGTVEDRKTFLTCQCPSAGGTLPRKASLGINHDAGIVFAARCVITTPPTTTYQGWQNPGPPWNRTKSPQEETSVSTSSKTQLQSKWGNAGERSAPRGLSEIDKQ